MNKILIYSVPVFSVLFFIFFLFTYNNDNNVTGLSTAEQLYAVDTNITLFVGGNDEISGDALFVVILDDRESNLTIKEFISKAGGEIKDVYYGELFYTLNLSNFDIDNKVKKGKHVLKNKILGEGIDLETKEDFEI